MSNGYACVLCGWQEVEHRRGSLQLGLTPDQIEERKHLLPGFTLVLYGDDSKGCTDYEASKDEQALLREHPELIPNFNASQEALGADSY